MVSRVYVTLSTLLLLRAYRGHTHTQHAPYSTHYLQPSRSALPRAPHAHASVQGTKRAPQAKYSPCCAKRAGFAVVGAALGLGFEGALALVTFATV